MFCFVSDKPFITPFRLQPVLVGLRADYLCSVRSQNDFKITWYKDGEKAENIEGIKVSNLSHSKVLSFSKVEKYHAGRYTCVVENEADKATYSTDFAVYGLCLPLKYTLFLPYLGVIRTQSNVYGGMFLRKWLTTKSCQLFSQKSTTVDVRLGSKYTSVTCL